MGGIALLVCCVRATMSSMTGLTALAHCAVDFDQHTFPDIEATGQYVCGRPVSSDPVVALSCLPKKCLFGCWPLQSDIVPYSCHDIITYVETPNLNSRVSAMSRL